MRKYESRITKDGRWRKDFFPALRYSLFVFIFFSFATRSLVAQPIHIATVRPDEAAPGMNVVLEILSVNENFKPFGIDGLDSRSQISLVHPQDSSRVSFGPVEVSWDGRILQVPVFILPNAGTGTVPFYIQSSVTGRSSDTIFFSIVSAQHLGSITGNVIIGGGIGALSAGNTIVVDSFVATNATIQFSSAKPDTLAGNPRFLPVVILSKGSVRLTNTTISVDADSLNGGPGGGGGGHGFPGPGGTGFTGGGSSSDTTLTNEGSAAEATLDAGGACATGIIGGGSEQSDQGGGGGTGDPYGVSGASGVGALNSPVGGFGAGSGAGEATSPFVEYGGGGGGFGTIGFGGGQLGGVSQNGGKVNGGRFLVPFAGGSGGGAGNSVDLGGATQGGSGGGGGGALEIIAFDSIVCNSVNLSARGDSGIAGVAIAAGGGGGSGGAIFLASPKGIRGSSTMLNVNGGSGGAGDTSGFRGGDGGFGRIRIDAANNLSSGSDTNVLVNGIAFTPSKNTVGHGFIRVIGVAQDVSNTLDTVRIYYRSQHSAWQSLDTVRAADGSWSKWIPALYDSLLFVVGMVEVNSPVTQQYNYEPAWLLSAASVSIFHTVPSPFLASIDTLNFGSVRAGRCKTLPIVISNNGEAPLILNGQVSANGKVFSIAPDTTISVPAYSADTLEVTFCPDSAGQVIGKITFLSNDSQNSPKSITLLGFGAALRDSLLAIPNSIHFDRVLLGQCSSDTVILKSVGHDPIYLDSSNWNDPPFVLRLVPPDTTLDSGVVRKLIVTFCPQDTGNIRMIFILDARGDSLPILGHGVRRLATSSPFLNAGVLCHGVSGAVVDTIRNLGNDTISIFSLGGNHIPFHSIGELSQPRSFDTIPILIPADTFGTFTDTVSILMAGDTLHTIIRYSVAGASLEIQPSVEYNFVCNGRCQLDTVPISNTGTDTVEISYAPLADSSFRLPDSITTLSPGQTGTLVLQFCPSDTIVHSDSLHFIAFAEGCESNFVIGLHGIGANSGLKADTLNFGAVATDTCIDSFITIGNPCGAGTMLDSILHSNPDFHIITLLPFEIPADNGSIPLEVQFCPSVNNPERDTLRLVFHNGDVIFDTLSGTGFRRALPSAAFTVSSTSVAMGDTAVTTVTFDTSTLKGSHFIHAIITFDPTVLSPIQAFPLLDKLQGSDSLTFSEILDFDSASFVEQITWLTLAGANNSSLVNLYITTDTPLNATVTPGIVTLTDCNGLAGHLASGGSYAFGTITPDPASEVASVTIQLGGDGYVEAGIYDMTGRLVENILQRNMKQGNYELIIPITSLATGRYMLQINSMGWRASAPLMIQR